MTKTAKSAILTLAAALILAGIGESASAKELSLKKEKDFVLWTTTSYEKRRIGGYPYARHYKMPVKFFVSTKHCDSNACVNQKPEATKVAKDFAKEFNTLIGKEVIIVSDSHFEGEVPIYLLDRTKRQLSGGVDFGWYCPDDDVEKGLMGSCSVFNIVTGSKKSYRRIPSKMMGVAYGLDAQLVSHKFIDKSCTFNYGKRGGGEVYKGLCPLEKKLIVFSSKHLKPGMKAGEISELFDKHWPKSPGQIKEAKELEKKALEKKATKKPFSGGGNR